MDPGGFTELKVKTGPGVAGSKESKTRLGHRPKQNKAFTGIPGVPALRRCQGHTPSRRGGPLSGPLGGAASCWLLGEPSRKLGTQTEPCLSPAATRLPLPTSLSPPVPPADVRPGAGPPSSSLHSPILPED